MAPCGQLARSKRTPGFAAPRSRNVESIASAPVEAFIVITCSCASPSFTTADVDHGQKVGAERIGIARQQGPTWCTTHARLRKVCPLGEWTIPLPTGKLSPMTSSARPVCLITGAATGIGAACARTFASHGWDVGICSLDDDTRPAADAVAAECAALGARAEVVLLNVTSDDSCRAAALTMREHFGRTDALVNCAGTTRFIPHADLEALPDSEFARTYDVNLTGTFRMIRACRDLLRESGRGAVVNLSSIAGTAGLGSSVAYAASKGAVSTLTLSLARALAPDIRVNAIAPGYVSGGLPSRVLGGDQLKAVEEKYLVTQALPRLLQVDEVAGLAYFLVAGAPGITGEVIRMDNGLHLHA